MTETLPPPKFPPRAPKHLPSRREVHDIESHQKRGPMSWVKEIGSILLVAFIFSTLIRAFVIQVFWIPSPSMETTLSVNDRVVISRFSAWTGDFERGDVVVFNDSSGWLTRQESTGIKAFIRKVGEFTGFVPANGEQVLVKRLIGLPGDTVECCSADGKIMVNGVAIDETAYLYPGVLTSEVPFKVTVPEGKVWVMGDNRPNSADSRFHEDAKGQGFVPISDIVGRGMVVIWPQQHWGGVSGRAAFESVPDPQ
ncbi:MAG: signal peptidase I [Actinobacteria bacterium]|nr:MAG: signal peptidase I [Actinomycetota bacterium]